jgi:hypothetical protein
MLVDCVMAESPRERTSRLSLPAKVAFDLENSRAVPGNPAERLGHPRCFSGSDGLFRLQKDFVGNPRTTDVDSRVAGEVSIER